MDLTVGPNVVVGESEHLYECLDLRVVPEGGERWGSEEDPGSVLGRHHGVCQPLGCVCGGVSLSFLHVFSPLVPCCTHLWSVPLGLVWFVGTLGELHLGESREDLLLRQKQLSEEKAVGAEGAWQELGWVRAVGTRQVRSEVAGQVKAQDTRWVRAGSSLAAAGMMQESLAGREREGGSHMMKACMCFFLENTLPSSSLCSV